MYLCPHCCVAYDEPLVIRETEDLSGEGCFDTNIDYRCPICGYPSDLENDRADQCDCGEWKPADEPCCSGCTNALRAAFAAFADRLTAGQEDALDDALDGRRVHDIYEKWRKQTV